MRLAVVLVALALVAGASAQYSYQDARADGPSRWNVINAACGTGAATELQSPINIQTCDARFDRALARRPLTITTAAAANQVQFQNDGNKIQVIMGNNGNSVTGGPLGHGVYTIHGWEIHWGPNSNVGTEHTINGAAAPGEIHVIAFRNNYANLAAARAAADNLAVTILSFQIQEGTATTVAAMPFFNAFTADVGAVNGLKNAAAGYNLANLLPAVADRANYYTYSGSFTNPNCDESVTNIVFSARIQMSAAQLTTLRTATLNNGDTQNFRPTQNTNNRPVRASWEAGAGTGCSNNNSLLLLLLSGFGGFGF